MVITREGFSRLVADGFAGLGFPAEAPTMIEFPMAMFVLGADLTPIRKNIHKIIEGLTQWEPTIKMKGAIKPETIITVQGQDYEEALSNMNLLFLRNLWGDGLPIQPATKRRVNWVLSGTDLPPDKVIGKILPRGGIATIETLAVNLAMTGGRPEYMPVLIAAVDSILEPEGLHRWWNTTTGDTYPVVIVNGPIAKQIRLNSGYGCMGPDPAHPAGGAIGRAIRQLLINVGGAIPGKGTMALFGGASRYTNVVFAEDEEGLPPDWKPLNVERGFPKGTNTVTVHCMGIAGCLHPCYTGTEEEVLETLDIWVAFLRIPVFSYWSNAFNPDGAAAIVLLGGDAAQRLSHLGWSKEKVKSFLWENSKVPESKLLRRWIERMLSEGSVPKEYATFPIPIAMSPSNIMIVVTGGRQSGHAHWMAPSLTGKNVITKEIILPANWRGLLKKADIDLGPRPDV
jgi:hypothetical protein